MTAPQEQDRPDRLAEQRVIASRLREARETLGLTQGDVATAIGIQRSGVSERFLAAQNGGGLR